MEQTDDIINELKIATGWKDISYVGDSFVIQLNIQEMRCIKGLKQGNECVHLEFEDFKHLPISFVVTVDKTVHQYWTLGRQLHRIKDRPAYVSYDPTKDRIMRRWYWNGLKHRTTGPAQEMIKSYAVVDIEGMPNYYQESWEYMSLFWFREGFPAKFPYCSEATIENGIRIRNKETGKIDSPRGDLSAFTSEQCSFIWDSHASKAFRPTDVNIYDLSEIYDDGVLKDRSCSTCDFSWKHGDSNFKANEHTKFNEEFKTSLLSVIDLWGEFYREDGDEFIVISEFNRITGDSQ
jgi:hypothetical protein